MAPDHYFASRPGAESKPRRITVNLAGDEVSVETDSGVFSGGRLDPGTTVLLAESPGPPATGELLDLGCGWGAIALSLARRSPEARVWAVDVNERALELVQRNAGEMITPHLIAATPEAVPADVEFDAIYSNPPIRIGKAALHDLLLAWIPRLRPGGDAWLVVAKQLGADSLQRWLAEQLGTGWLVERTATSKGFRILHIHRD